MKINMEMWVRSQDKKKFMKVNCFEIVGKKILGYQQYIEFGNEMFQSDTYVVLGEYKTEERAIEVLNEIQSGITLSMNGNYDYEQADIEIKKRMLITMNVIYNMQRNKR